MPACALCDSSIIHFTKAENRRAHDKERGSRHGSSCVTCFGRWDVSFDDLQARSGIVPVKFCDHDGHVAALAALFLGHGCSRSRFSSLFESLFYHLCVQASAAETRRSLGDYKTHAPPGKLPSQASLTRLHLLLHSVTMRQEIVSRSP